MKLRKNFYTRLYIMSGNTDAYRVESLRQDIISAYMHFRSRCMQDPFQLNERNISDFEKAAKLCKKMNMRPWQFVEFQFRRCVDKKAFYPRMLLVRASEEERNTVRHWSEIPCGSVFNAQLSYLYDHLKLGRVLENILMDDKIDFHAWFRVIISKERIPEVMAKYGELGKREVTAEMLDFLKTKNLEIARLQ